MNADLILVLDQGQVVQSGTHAELLAQEGASTARSSISRPASMMNWKGKSVAATGSQSLGWARVLNLMTTMMATLRRRRVYHAIQRENPAAHPGADQAALEVGLAFLAPSPADLGLDSYFTFLGKRIIDEGIMAQNRPP
jgi:hypothetical protein